MAKVLIRDGYKKTTTMPARFGMPAVTFSYRPALPVRAWEYGMAVKDTAAKQTNEVIKLLTDHVVSWDIEGDKDGETAEVNAANIKRCPRPLLEFFVDCICGYGPDAVEADQKN